MSGKIKYGLRKIQQTIISWNWLSLIGCTFTSNYSYSNIGLYVYYQFSIVFGSLALFLNTDGIQLKRMNTLCIQMHIYTFILVTISKEIILYNEDTKESRICFVFTTFYVSNSFFMLKFIDGQMKRGNEKSNKYYAEGNRKTYNRVQGYDFFHSNTK